MATRTIPEKTTATEERELAESQVGLLTREEVAEIEAEIAVILAPTLPAAAPALPRKMSLLAMILHPAKAFWGEISGPAMTARDRDARDLREARNHCHPRMAGL